MKFSKMLMGKKKTWNVTVQEVVFSLSIFLMALLSV